MSLLKRKIRSFESLESRYALAGNVTASVDGGGNLLISGDSLANGIIFNEVSTGKFDLTGIDAGGSGTSINGGAANNTVRLNGVTGSITIRGKEGDDNIQLPYFNYGGWMVINTGDGNDTLSLGDDAKASFLVGVLSIRTNEGTKTITETNINVIGNQDLGGTQTDGGAASANELNFSITGSTFGSFLYFNYGGRAGSLTMQTTVQAGNVFLYNRVTRPGQLFGPDEIVPIDRTLEFQYLNSSMGGNLTYDVTSKSDFTMEDYTVLGVGDVLSVGPSNTMRFDGGSFEGLTLATRDSYRVKQALPYLTHDEIVESNNDDIYVGYTYVSGDISLQSNGELRLIGVTAGESVLAALNNSHAVISAETSVFANLTLSLGSTAEPTDYSSTSSPSSPEQVTQAQLYACRIDGTLTIDTSSRIRSSSYLGTEGVQNKYTSINQASASYTFTSSVIGNVNMASVTEEGTVRPGGAIPGSNSFNFLTSQLESTTISLPRSNDSVTFNGSYVANSTFVDGGAGTDSFSNIGSVLTNLQKLNFEN